MKMHLIGLAALISVVWAMRPTLLDNFQAKDMNAFSLQREGNFIIKNDMAILSKVRDVALSPPAWGY
jgi:hypothetical protein